MASAFYLSLRRVLIPMGYRAEFYVGPYRLDFALVNEKINIESDGDCHNSVSARKKDKKRDQFLNSLGWKTFRIKEPKISKWENSIAVRFEIFKALNEHGLIREAATIKSRRKTDLEKYERRLIRWRQKNPGKRLTPVIKRRLTQNLWFPGQKPPV